MGTENESICNAQQQKNKAKKQFLSQSQKTRINAVRLNKKNPIGDVNSVHASHEFLQSQARQKTWTACRHKSGTNQNALSAKFILVNKKLPQNWSAYNIQNTPFHNMIPFSYLQN